jgi:hypothetical protein
MIRGSSGGTFVGQRASGRPSPPTRCCVKFHSGGPARLSCSPRLPTLVQLLQALVMRRVAALAGGVDDQAVEVELGAVEEG